MILFFDTNVLIDHALVRLTGQPIEISFIIYWAKRKQVDIVISSGSFYTFTYVLHKQGIRRGELKNKLLDYLSMVSVASSSKDSLLDGINSSFVDLEDSYQYMTAIQEKCDYLITSNISDFKSNKKDMIKPITPLDFVTKILGKKKGIDY
ncbi:PIN domain-containing protein [Dyadobacter sp. CY345]|uniref:PIN domain-containing protein n=1 Tax=Dyadobacter sp. CY345 TaxID=2909335 RepID=UPI001F2027A5|nr:PIN domain-containing protein [Dyadobacter sp. CY345]MCF2446396.1 PIN domain-containing protein [Dyadobacter sp. CY345]